MNHPGDNWSRMTPRSYTEPVLYLSAHRCIYTMWPPGALCEACGCGQQAGYAGPVALNAHDIRYPAPHIRFICRNCARGSLGLGEDELSGHQCQERCTDELHEQGEYLQYGALDGLSAEGRVAHFASDYAHRGWRVVEVAPAMHLPAATGKGWAIRFVPTRHLP